MRIKRLLLIFFAILFGEILTLLVLFGMFPSQFIHIVRSLTLVQGIYSGLLLVVMFLIIALSLSTLLSIYLVEEEKALQGVLTQLLHSEENEASVKEELNYLPEQTKTLLVDLQQQISQWQQTQQQHALQKQEVNGLREDYIVKKERQRIARELHDSVSQQLFAMTMVLSAIEEEKEQLPKATQNLISQVVQMINFAQAEMRALLLHLRPLNLMDKPLDQGIEQLFKELDTKVAMTLETRLNPVNLPHEIEDNLFRIVQELLSNSLRHAKATVIECELFNRQSYAIIRFIDNGVGFKVNGQSSTSGYGLKNIQERVTQFGGNFKIMSEPDEGTVVEIAIPK